MSSSLLLVGLALAGPQLTDGEGSRLAWPLPSGVDQPVLTLVGNPLNASGTSADQVQHAVVRSLMKWEEASEGALTFSYWQDPTYPTRVAHDGLSTLFFLSQNPDVGLQAGTVGYTHLWTDENGHIDEVDIVLNDWSWRFSPDPEQAAYDIWADPTVYLDDVLVHELGHAYGLDHSGLMHSSQLTWSWAGQHTLSCEEQVAIRGIYSNRDHRLGARVLDPSGRPIHGAQVVALSPERRRPVASTLTNAEGAFVFAGLDAGSYFLLVEPFLGGAENLSPYWADLDVNVCDGKPFSRTFFLDRFEAGAAHDPLQVHCGPVVPESRAGETPDLAPVLLSGAQDVTVLLDRLEPTGTRRFYALRDIEGTLTVSVLTHTLFSPIWVSLELWDAHGNTLYNVLDATPAWTDEVTGETSYDAALAAVDLPRGDYTLAMRSNALPSDLYPQADLAVDADPFALVFAEVGEHEVETWFSSTALTCQQPEPDPSLYVPRGTPPEIPTCGCQTSTPSPLGWLLLPLLAACRRTRP